MADDSKKLARTLQSSLKSGALESYEERGGCIWAKVRQGDLITACGICMAGGAVFDSAFISPQGKAGSFMVHYLFRMPGISRMVVLQAQGKEFAALSERTNAALWDERKMQDLTGLKLQGIPDPRPLIFHPESGMPDSHPQGAGSS